MPVANYTQTLGPHTEPAKATANTNVSGSFDCAISDTDDTSSSSWASSNLSEPLSQVEFTGRKEIQPQTGGGPSVLTSILRGSPRSDSSFPLQWFNSEPSLNSVPMMARDRVMELGGKPITQRRLLRNHKTDAAYLDGDRPWECCGCGALNTKWEFNCGRCRLHAKKSCCRDVDSRDAVSLGCGDRRVKMVPVSKGSYISNWVVEANRLLALFVGLGIFLDSAQARQKTTSETMPPPAHKNAPS
ncbi:hypothetical protein B0T16DRAFT_385008 [Cercophora newfieldiana]|uniref:RanBP2-type domain-containing protein n=1 Tax=Cercophora newfieldiana TaxID=92897 RepID=A0AA40D0Q0_9PEZI|nr:hypothetical protein B0T16DRAFT_385008 [Cercophora newfieldiana]